MTTLRSNRLEEIAARIAACTRCPLHRTRTKTVPGEGPEDAPVALIGEGPGRVEDESGRPFVGPAGRLLDELLLGAGISREKVWIGNAARCRAHTDGRDRPPTAQELAACRPFLHEQLAALHPAIIVLLGRTAAHSVLGMPSPLDRLRQRVFRQDDRWALVTYHPSAELHVRNGSVRGAIAADLELLRDLIDVEWGTRAWPWSDEALTALFGEADWRLPSTGAVGGIVRDVRSSTTDSGPPADPALEAALRAERLPRVIWHVAGLRAPFRESVVVRELLRRFAQASLTADARIGPLRGHDENGFSIAPWHGPYLSAPVDTERTP